MRLVVRAVCRSLSVTSAALALGGTVVSNSVLAQGGAAPTGTVSGVVTDRSSRLPLADARVAISGTTLGALTNARGEYRMPNVPAGRVIVAAYRLGYGAMADTIRVAAGENGTADFAMAQSVTTLSDVVVTGTVGNQERRAQAATVSSIAVGDIKKEAPISNVNDLLQSRLPGVAVSSASGTAGTSRQIRIRGASSISLSNQPLIFIDGVRYNDGNVNIGLDQRTDRLNDLNPDDIESVEVVKGPAAATLYGADASTGVIQIITKRGRTGSNSFAQTIRTEYGKVDRNFDPPDNYGNCTAALVAASSTNPLCRGQAVGTLVHDNPLLRTDAFRGGSDLDLGWTGRGGGQNYGYFLSGGATRNIGVLPNNDFERLSTRVNFNWIPNAKLTLESGASLNQSQADLPDNDNNIYGFLGGALLGSPLTRSDAAAPSSDGWFGFNRHVQAIENIKNQLMTRRSLINSSATFLPTTWFKNRFTVGADIVSDDATRFFPKNGGGQYAGLLNTGNNVQTRRNVQRYTVDYLADLNKSVMRDALQLNLSLGAQVIATRDDNVAATGQGFTSNSSSVIGSASTTSAIGGRTDTRQVGYLGQLQAGWRDRLFLQVGARMDDFSAFGQATDPIILPKVGVSWVVSDYAFFQPLTSVISSFRLRGAVGTTGRAPTAGAALQTLNPAPYAITNGTTTTVESGATPLNPGNSDLKPEKGQEIEAGFDASVFGDRVNIEVTYFDKTSKNLLLQRPLPPSLGFQQNPFVNIGEMYNRGWEVSLGGTPVRLHSFDWDSRLSFNTLDNKVVDLGGVSPFGTLIRVTQGFPLQSWVSQRIRNIDQATGVVTVADTFEVMGNTLPTFEGSWTNTFTIMRNLRVTALFDTKQDFMVYNQSDFFRETQVVRSANRLDQTKLSPEERLRRYGNQAAGKPAFVTETGRSATVDVVRDAYLQPGDFVRFRELGFSYSVPSRLLGHMRGVSAATLGIAFQNLALWTDYQGFDPEVISTAGNGFLRDDFFTLPNPRRALLRLNVTF